MNKVKPEKPMDKDVIDGQYIGQHAWRLPRIDERRIMVRVVWDGRGWKDVKGDCRNDDGAIRLNLGAREHRIKGFKSIDLGHEADYRQDVRDLRNFSTDSVTEIYASHILEHIKKPDVVGALREWHRVLKPGGFLYISVPDFGRVVESWLRCGRVLHEWHIDILYGNQGGEGEYHYQCYDANWLGLRLVDAGFDREKVWVINRMPYGVGDRSNLADTIDGKPISLNVRAEK